MSDELLSTIGMPFVGGKEGRASDIFERLDRGRAQTGLSRRALEECASGALSVLGASTSTAAGHNEAMSVGLEFEVVLESVSLLGLVELEAKSKSVLDL